MRIRLHFGIVACLGSIAALGGTQGGCSDGSARSQSAFEACVDSVPKPSSAPEQTSDKLVGVGLVAGDVESADASMRAALVAQMRSNVNSARYSAIVQSRCEPLRPKDPYGNMGDGASSGGGSASPPSASQVSGTNNQVKGVDEADFVKNDGRYIYTATGTSLHIVEAWPAASMHVASEIAVEGKPLKLFVVGDRALVYSSLSKSNASGQSYTGAGGCTYGYDCDFSGDGTPTVLSFFDITDRSHPRLLRKLQSSASLIAARRIGNAVHTVLGQVPTSPGYPTYPESKFNNTEADIHRAFDALIAKNEEALAKVSMKTQLPTFDTGGGAAPVFQLLQSALLDGVGFTTVLSVDIADDVAPLNAVTVLTRPGAVYASSSALYVAVPHQRSRYGWYEEAGDVPELSSVHKFGIGETTRKTEYLASGLVKGRVLNQFAMDEKDNHLRIATTTGHLPDVNVHNTLSVLEQQGPALKLAGRIDGIAKGEDIRSVRFDGDRGFMVTFKKTDPLYAFDLSNPREPSILGELKIPGFSTYMHLMDPTHLLTIGYDADDHGSFAYFDGVLLQIFDVSNPVAPALVHKSKIGTRGSSSEALADHLAFNYFVPDGAKQGSLALPMTICEGGGDGTYGSEMTFSGLLVYDVSLDHGFGLRGQVAHPNTPSGRGYDRSGCYNWWTNASSEVKRSIFMDDMVYSVSSTRIKANQLQTLSADVAEVSIR